MWLDAAARSDRTGFGVLLDEWERVLPGRLSRTETLGRRSGSPVLVYVLEGDFGGDRYCAWVAALPRPRVDVPEHLLRLPSDVLALHTRLHDEIDLPLFRQGVYADPNRPFEMYPPVAQPVWNQIVVIQNDGGSARLCATLGDDPKATAGWYWYEGTMSPEPDIWVLADDWLLHGASGY